MTTISPTTPGVLHGRHSMKGDQFLTVALNLLHRALVEAPRPQAKALFRRLQGEESVTLTNVRLEDQSTVRFDLALETSAYRGRLTFGALRAATGLLIHNIGESLRAGTIAHQFYRGEGPAPAAVRHHRGVHGRWRDQRVGARGQDR